MTTVIGGEPASPSDSTSQPTRSSTAWRAAARHVTCAIWQPVTKANDAVAGIPRRSLSHSPATSSTTAADGPQTTRPGVLIPRRREPVRRESGRERAADDEAEVAPAGDCRRRRARLRPRASMTSSGSVGAPERPAERRAQLVDARRRPDRPLVERLDEVRRDLRRSSQQLALVVTRASLGSSMSRGVLDEREHVLPAASIAFVRRRWPSAPRKAAREVDPEAGVRITSSATASGRHDERRYAGTLRSRAAAPRPPSASSSASRAAAVGGEEARATRCGEARPHGAERARASRRSARRGPAARSPSALDAAGRHQASYAGSRTAVGPASSRRDRRAPISADGNARSRCDCASRGVELPAESAPPARRSELREGSRARRRRAPGCWSRRSGVRDRSLRLLRRGGRMRSTRPRAAEMLGEHRSQKAAELPSAVERPRIGVPEPLVLVE